MSKADNSHAIHYSELLANWPKGIGPKPTNAMFAVAHACGKQLTGKKHAITIAMAQRDCGVNDYEHIVAAAAFDHVAVHQQKNLINYLRDACTAGFLTDHGSTVPRRKNPLTGKAERVWQVTVTDRAAFEKGILPGVTERAELKAAPLRAKAKAAQQAKRATAKAKAQATRKAKKALPAPPVSEPVSEPTFAPADEQPATFGPLGAQVTK